MKPCQTLYKRKHPRKGEKKEARGKDQSSCKQRSQQKRQASIEVRESLSTETSKWDSSSYNRLQAMQLIINVW
jgi:hypothetical protein